MASKYSKQLVYTIFRILRDLLKIIIIYNIIKYIRFFLIVFLSFSFLSFKQYYSKQHAAFILHKSSKFIYFHALYIWHLVG